MATKLPTGSGLIDPTRPPSPAASRGWGPSDLAEPAIPPLVGYAEIAEMAGVSRQRARELPNLPDFPPAVTETSSKGPLRVRSQVANWIQGWERRAGRPPTPPSNRPTSNTLANYPVR